MVIGQSTIWPNCTKRRLTASVLAAVLCLVVSFAGQSRAAQTVVSDIRVGESGAVTRFVLELSHKVSARLFTLGNPNRIVIDLPAVGWRLPQQPLPTNVGHLKRLRYGLFKATTTRIVLDLAKPATVANAFLLAPSKGKGYRFVVDMKSATQGAFLATVKSPPSSVNTVIASAPPLKKPVAGPFPLPLRKPDYAGRKRIVIVDPGHGGVDPGAISVNGVYEKHITLAAARQIKAALERSGRYQVIMTRNRDVFIRLRDRLEFARENNGELFISVHADAMENHKIRGLSVYTLSQKASDRVAQSLAVSENKADLIGGVDLTGETPEVTNILIDLAQRETMNQSVRFAAMLVNELRRDVKVLKNTHRFAGFAVLKAPDVPSVLMELGFLSNRQEEKALRTKAYRKKLAHAVVRAIDRYFVRVEEASRR